MSTPVKIPALGESVTSGVIATWLVADGDFVEAGQPIFELETDKVTAEGNADVSGVIALKAAEGDEVEVGHVVAEIDEAAQAPTAASEAKPAEPTPEPQPSSSASAPVSAAPSSDAVTEEIEVKIPALGESVTSGILATWLVADGARVESGQAIFELETDKVTAEGNAEATGVLHHRVEEGTEVEVGAVVAVIAAGAGAPAPEAVAAPATTTSASPAQAPVPGLPQSPAVKRLAAETGINPDTVAGSGKGGRVTKGDMLAAQASGKAPAPAPVPAAPPSAPPAAAAPTKDAAAASPRTTRKKMSPLRRTIASRLVQAQHENAMLTTFNEVDMSAVMSLRKKHQEAFVGAHGIKLGFMSFFTKAAVAALQAVPGVNGQIDGEEIIQNHYYDIGIAVSTPKGLMVPVVRDCDQKSFAQIEQDIIGYAKKAKDGKITIGDMQGGVFTITNGGIFGSMLSTPILNQPQSAILGMHTIKERPIAENGQVVIRPMMYLALSYDHRLVDGKEAVTFLVKIKEAIEDPTRLLFGV